jgi:serpin B
MAVFDPADRDKAIAAQGALLKKVATMSADKDSGVVLNIATAAWFDSGFDVKKAYVAEGKTKLQAEVATANFKVKSTAATINAWAAKNTNDKIKEITNSDELSRFVFALLNATYFKGLFAQPFNERATRAEDFILASGEKVSADFMTKTDRLTTIDTGDSVVVELPYGKDGAAKLRIIMPKDTAKLQDTLSSLVAKYPRVSAQLASAGQTKIVLQMPKFEFKNSHKLNDTLKAMGMKISFTDDANLSGISEDPTHVDLVRQNTYIKTDEKGSEAAAVTIIGGMRSTSIQRPPPLVRIDRPFIFTIDLDGVVLFAGVVNNPTEK